MCVYMYVCVYVCIYIYMFGWVEFTFMYIVHSPTNALFIKLGKV